MVVVFYHRFMYISRETESEKKQDATLEVAVIMTDAEMNKLGAKIVKAELMGDNAKAKKLKETLENARKAKEDSKNNPQSTVEENAGEETVVLARTDR